MSYSLNNLADLLGRCRLDDEHRVVQPPIEIKSRSDMVNTLMRALDYACSLLDYNESYRKVSLTSPTREYLDVKRIFDNTIINKRVTGIEKILNPCLYAQYQLKLAEKKSRYGAVKELTLFHGTKARYLDSICENNFDRSKIGCHGFRASRFGRGISFSPSANYASAYPRRHMDSPRKMLVVKVLEVSRCPGTEGLLIPREPHDTSYGMAGNVVVKYFDNEFYPQYIISYE